MYIYTYIQRYRYIYTKRETEKERVITWLSEQRFKSAVFGHRRQRVAARGPCC